MILSHEEYMRIWQQSNPFYSNYVFHAVDLQRAKLSRLDRIWLWLFPTHVQVSEGRAWFYKRVGGKVYLLREEEL